HQTHERLAETDAVAKERSIVTPADVQERVIALFLVLVEDWINLRLAAFPFGFAGGVMLEQLLQCFGINIERRIFVDLPLDDANDFLCNVLGLLPMLLEPGLELGHVTRRTNLNVEFNILREARNGEITRTDQRYGADDLNLRVSD